jgi:hypothetical protein
MSVTHTIRGDILTLVTEGDFSIREFFDALQRGMQDRDFKAPMRALIDGRKSEVNPSQEGLEDPLRFYAEIKHCFTPGWAIVAGSDISLFGMARLICTYTDFRGVDMRAYSDIDEARSRLTWNNSYQQDPFCMIQTASCRPNFIRTTNKAKEK